MATYVDHPTLTENATFYRHKIYLFISTLPLGISRKGDVAPSDLAQHLHTGSIVVLGEEVRWVAVSQDLRKPDLPLLY